MSKKVIVTGATGLLGRQVVKTFKEAGWEVTGTGFTRANPPQILKVDLSSEEEVGTLLDDIKPLVVVHCAAEKSPDRCATDPAGTKELNVNVPGHLAKQTKQRGIFLIYISTDYVFDGRPGAAPYEADAETSPPNFYGETKRAGEIAVLEASDKAVVVRVPLLYGSGENYESAVNVLMDAIWNKSGKENIDMDHWAIRYPTNTEDVARVLKDVAVKYTTEDSAAFPKILQFSSEDSCTKYRAAPTIHYGFQCILANGEMGRYEICQRLAQVLALPMPHITANDTNDPNASGELIIRGYEIVMRR
ncbi:hypothetical protein ABW19_dt0202740 [Dactylella cylindrospora]|nr:hypothetical protein ABW19_dt0202740 [Dactylella cylindrospora]